MTKTPIPITQCVTVLEYQGYDVQVTKMVPKPITETIPVTVCVMVPESTTVVVPTVKCRPVTETVTRQVAVCTPYQVPVTVMTTQTPPRDAAGSGVPDGHGTGGCRSSHTGRVGANQHAFCQQQVTARRRELENETL